MLGPVYGRLEIKDMHTFATPLRHALQNAPDKLAVVSGERRFSYAELAARCEQLAGALYSLGLNPGDRVAILANNSHEYIETYIAVPAAGLVVVPLNTRHAGPELKYALEDSGARVLITDRDSDELNNLVEHVIQCGDDYDARLAKATPKRLGEGVSESDLAGLFYTGGTTGKSKGVMLSHRNLVANARHWMLAAPQGPDDVFLIVAPLFHAAGSNGVLASIWTLGTQVTLGAFDPAAALDLIQEYKASATLGVPTMLAAMAELQLTQPRECGTLRLIAHGGSPIATEVVRRTSQAFPSAQLMEVYGCTETSPLCTVLGDEQTLMDSPRARSCGRAVIGCEITIRDPNGKALPLGEIGEVVASGPHIMQGYWQKQEQTNAVLRPEGYWTGDLGYMDEEGFVFLVDRSKDMIVSGGENVYCTEVEEVLYQHPAVLEAAAFGVPDDKWGEAVWATVVPREGNNALGAEELISFCREHIAGYKVPKGIDIQFDPLPKSGPGKVLKRELRAPYWEGKDVSVN